MANGLESLGKITFLRTYSKDGKEDWAGTVNRYLDFMVEKYPKLESVIRGYGQEIHNETIVPSMRFLQYAGEPIAKHHARGYNCSYLAPEDFQDFGDMCYLLACGCGVGVGVMRRYSCKIPALKEEGKGVVFTVPDSKEGWGDSYVALLTNPFIEFDYSLVSPAGSKLSSGGTACLTGDTVVYKDRKKSKGQNTVTLKELFDLKNGDRKHTFSSVKIRSLDEEKGTFFRNRILDVVSNGVCDVYVITTRKGYSIKATENHRFLTDSGEYAFVRDLRVGGLIGVNGRKEILSGTCIDCGKKISRRSCRCVACHNVAQLKMSCSRTTARARKQNKDARKTECKICGIEARFNQKKGEIGLQNHHIDRNPYNNNADNLVTLCEPCHHKLHAREDKLGNAYSHRYLDFDDIVSIDLCGKEEVYDVSMEGPNHNFIANGFVSHNSGPAPLKESHEKIRAILLKCLETGCKKLLPIDIADISCIIAEAIVSGGSRRSALIILFDSFDVQMQSFKTGNWWDTHIHRAKANISEEVETGSSQVRFCAERAIDSATGEPAYVLVKSHGNREANTGVNPCQPAFATVLTKEGIRTFADIEAGTEIWDGKKFVKIIKKWSTGEKDVYQYTTVNGFFVGTSNHPVLSGGNVVEAGKATSLDCNYGGEIVETNIVSTRHLGQFEVFDITVDSEEHVYWTGGCIVHNCCEISLGNRQMCNLSEVILPHIKSKAGFITACTAASLFGTLQAGFTDFAYIKPEWRINVEKDALIGVSLTGQAQKPEFITSELLRHGAEAVVKTNKIYAKKIGINPSSRCTTSKPSGSTSCVMRTTSGIHAAHAEWVIRRIRLTKLSSLAKTLIFIYGISPSSKVKTDHGEFNLPEDKYHFIVEEAYSDKDIVLQFPCRYENAIYKSNESSVELLERAADVYLNWVKPGHITGEETNNVSLTVAHRPHEREEIVNWLVDNQDKYRGVSMLPEDTTAYPLLPFEEVSIEEWNKYQERFPDISWESLGVESEMAGSVACSGGSCEIR